ncbi:MmgE/PrpD family protein [Bordetella genomosp. 8]|uniref:MmgE/PrpD family protein n=1 Tax=Bordetella genomosp. 8 TaxID=1416806 RepID=UPI0012FDDCAD|nr:MmgE/PrpD family protein [Bordetella genomosp. 8]
MGVTEQLARFAIETPAGVLTPALARSAKTKFFDTIGIMVAGAHHPAGIMAANVARHMGGHPSVTLIGRDERTSAPVAGFVNGVAAHALEYDDYTRGVGHASVVLVPGCLAMAESLRLSGARMLEAFVLGFEVTSRIAKGLRPTLLDKGWHPIGIVGGQGVAVACGRMMGLDVRQTRMAMGIMASSGSGVRKNVGSMGKAYHVGHGVRSGIFAAMLAREGFVVDPDIIEGSDEGGEGHQRYGLADSYNGVGQYRLHLMTEGLGRDLEVGKDTTMLRMHPGSTAPGAGVDGLIALADEHRLRPEDVENIHYECTPQCVAIAPYAEPSDEHRAKFCLPYTMAVAFLDRKVGIAQYADARIADPEVRGFMKRITVTQPDDLKHHRGQWGENGVNWAESRITIRLKDGRELKRACSHANGYPEMPASWEDQKEKYVECTHALFSPGQIDDTVAMIAELDTLPDVGELARALTPRRR